MDQWQAIPEYADISEKLFLVSITTNKLRDIATQAARWGADQELEACCHLLRQQGFDVVDDLRAARRPKPLSLKEQALEAAQRFYANGHEDCSDEEIKDDFDIIRRALESLPD